MLITIGRFLHQALLAWVLGMPDAPLFSLILFWANETMEKS
jgi:hypothetical protein